jgi:hypothetical protein
MEVSIHGPPFPSGAGHIINFRTLKLINGHYDEFVEYQGEDTSLGIFFDEMNSNHNVKVNFRTSKCFITHRSNCMDKNFFVIDIVIWVQMIGHIHIYFLYS